MDAAKKEAAAAFTRAEMAELKEQVASKQEEELTHLHVRIYVFPFPYNFPVFIVNNDFPCRSDFLQSFLVAHLIVPIAFGSMPWLTR